MKNFGHFPLAGFNPFSALFREFDEDAFFQQLHERVKPKSYFHRYKGFKTTVLWLSYFFNFASAVTASFAVFWLVEKLTGFAPVAWMVAAVALFFLEKVKRKSSGEFWQIYYFEKSFAYGWFALSLLCFAASAGSSSFGVKEGVELQAPSPTLVQSDSSARFYRSEIAVMENKNTDLRNNRDKNGITFYNLSGAISANEKSIADYRARALELEKETAGENHKLSADHKADIALSAFALVWLNVGFEFLFELCLCYIWYYYRRSYIERVQTALRIDGREAPHPHDPKGKQADEKLDGIMRELEQAQPPPFMAGFGHVNKAAPSSAQMCADDQNDLYTVAHTYTRNKQKKTVRYTMNDINRRVRQYEKDLAEAEQKQLAPEVIENRQQWLFYWLGKRRELELKLEKATAA